MKNVQKGFIARALLVFLAILVISAGVFYYFMLNNQIKDPELLGNPATYLAGIAVSSPKANELVKLPITVQGMINGRGWSANEGEAGSVEVFDSEGRAISSRAVLKTTTDWRNLPTSFEAMVGDRQMMSNIMTDAGYLKFTSSAEKDGQIPQTLIVPVRFK